MDPRCIKTRGRLLCVDQITWWDCPLSSSFNVARMVARRSGSLADRSWLSLISTARLYSSYFSCEFALRFAAEFNSTAVSGSASSIFSLPFMISFQSPMRTAARSGVCTIPVMRAVADVRVVVECTEVMPVLMIKASRSRQVRAIKFSQVPLAGNCRFVSSLFERTCKGALRQRQTPLGMRSHNCVNTCSSCIATRHQGSSRGRTNRLNVKRFEHRAAACEFIEIRRFDFLATAKAAVGITKIIHQNENDVWLRGRRLNRYSANQIRKW